jgi:hypothetical protein
MEHAKRHTSLEILGEWSGKEHLKDKKENLQIVKSHLKQNASY